MRDARSYNQIFRGIAQLVEQWSPKPRAEGSSPSAPAIKNISKKAIPKPFSGCFFLSGAEMIPKLIPLCTKTVLQLCNTNCIVKCINRFNLCFSSPLNIDTFSCSSAFVAEQYSNIL